MPPTRFRTLYEHLLAGTNAKRLPRPSFLTRIIFWPDANGYPALDYSALTDALRAQAEFAAHIDLIGTPAALDNYYRTDSHWRQETLLPAAARRWQLPWALPCRRRPIGSGRWTRPYYGVYYGYAALPMEPDAPAAILPTTFWTAARVYNYETGKTGCRLRSGAKAPEKIPMSCFSPAPCPC